MHKLIVSQDWFTDLTEEIKSVNVESIFISRIELLKGKWLIGELIEKKIGDFKRNEIYGEKINDLIAKGVGMSPRELQRCRMFYRKFNDEDWDKVVGMLPEGKNISWSKVLMLLNTPKEREVEAKECYHERLLVKCLDCGKVLVGEEFTIRLKRKV